MTELTRNQIEALRIYATTAGKPIDDVSAFELLMAAKAGQHFKSGLLDPKVLESLCTLATKALDQADALAEAEKRGYDAAKEQAAKLAAVHGLKELHMGDVFNSDSLAIAAAIRAMVKP